MFAQSVHPISARSIEDFAPVLKVYMQGLWDQRQNESHEKRLKEVVSDAEKHRPMIFDCVKEFKRQIAEMEEKESNSEELNSPSGSQSIPIAPEFR